MKTRPHPAPKESLPSYAARMYDALGIGDLYDDDAWVKRASAEELPNASATPDRPKDDPMKPRYQAHPVHVPDRVPPSTSWTRIVAAGIILAAAVYLFTVWLFLQ